MYGHLSVDRPNGYRRLYHDVYLQLYDVWRYQWSRNFAGGAEQGILKARILAAGNLLGILGEDPQAWLQDAGSASDIDVAEIESLIAQRDQAKNDKDYARADEIRQSLLDQGVVLEDSREGTRWKRG